MAQEQEKDYSDIVQEQAEKLKEALKKKRRDEAVDDAIGGIAGVVFGGPMFVLLIMFFSLVACTTLCGP